MTNRCILCRTPVTADPAINNAWLDTSGLRRIWFCPTHQEALKHAFLEVEDGGEIWLTFDGPTPVSRVPLRLNPAPNP